jgi:subtilisin family serine protease
MCPRAALWCPRRRIALALLLGMLTACGGGDGGGNTAPPTAPPPPPAPPVAVASVTVTPDSADLALAGTLQLSAVVRDAQGATLTGRPVTWTSAEPAIATVSATGLVTAVVAGRVQVTASVEGRSASTVVRVRGVADTLPGDAAAPAVAAIPLRVAQTRAEDYRTDHPELGGVTISINTVMVLLEPAATIGQLNALLRSVDAQVVGGVPGAAQAAGVLVLRLPTRTHAELAAALTTLRQSALIRSAVEDLQLEGSVVSAVSSDAEEAAWRWGTLTTTMEQGNWGLKAMRVPQLWNLNEHVRRAGATTVTAVFDGGFVAHPDLRYASDITPPEAITSERGRRHGTHVAGTIAATHDNGLGVDGVNPFARLVVKGGASVSTFVTGFAELLMSTPAAGRPRVINLSLSYEWGKKGVNTTLREFARSRAQSQGLMVEAMLAAVQRFSAPLPLIVAAAGNDRIFFPAQEARFASPFANAAIERGVQAIMVVEAVQLDPGGTLSQATFSNDGGHLSAPGVQIMSTVPAVAGASAYGRANGTSMAAPLVTGLVGYLLALDPSFPAPTMTSNPMLDLLRATAVPVSGASPRVDAFAAVIELDRVRGNDRVLRALLDVDDGTIDGNQRVDLRTGAAVLGDAAGARDGRIDMRDFRRWRDHVLQTEADVDLRLDGSPTHPKRDLNEDGVVGTSEQENVYPRTDFNGDGRLSRATASVMPGVFRGERITDLQVFRRLFEDPDYTEDELFLLLESGDLLFDPVACLAVPGTTNVRATLRREEEETAFRVFDLTPASPRKMVTAAADDTDYRARLSARDARGEELAYFERKLRIGLGEDVLIEGECFRLDVDVIFPAEVAAGAPQPLNIKVTRVRPRLEQESLVANADVTITVIGGEAASAFGTTNAAGEFSTTIRPDAGPSSVTVIIEVETENGGTSVRATRPIAGALPCAAGTEQDVFATSDSELSRLLGLGRTTRSVAVTGQAFPNRTFEQLVDLRRFCESGWNFTVGFATFRGGVRIDGLELVGSTREDNAIVNFNTAGRLLVEAAREVEHISLPRLRFVGHPLGNELNSGVQIIGNPDLRTFSMGHDVPLMEITALRIMNNPKLTSARVFSEMKHPDRSRFFGRPDTDLRTRRVEISNNAALETAVFGRINTIELRVVNNASLRTLTFQAGVISRTTITGNPLLQSVSASCATLLSGSITIIGSPKLDVAALNAQAASCASAMGVTGPPPRVITRE